MILMLWLWAKATLTTSDINFPPNSIVPRDNFLDCFESQRNIKQDSKFVIDILWAGWSDAFVPIIFLCSVIIM